MTNEQKEVIKEQAAEGRTVVWESKVIDKNGDKVSRIVCSDPETAGRLLEHAACWIYTTTMLLDDLVDIMVYLDKEGFNSPTLKRLKETAMAIAPYHRHTDSLTQMILGNEEDKDL